jgi:hypothetical protein
MVKMPWLSILLGPDCRARRAFVVNRGFPEHEEYQADVEG